ncbi:MAG: GDP-mannose 4,6-dehydratase [Planctomycetota bacterium]|nr:GDP-mannose 4,6-dehydratase [Planctomycetota bacterium]
MATPPSGAGQPQHIRPASTPTPASAAKPAAKPAAAPAPAKAPLGPQPPKERILVTGAAGFIGSHLIPRLLAAGHPVSGMVRYERRASDSSKRRMVALEALQARFKDRLQLVQCDDGLAMNEVVARTRPEICIHLAGRSWIRESVAWPELYVEANYRTTVGLLNALHLSACRRLVFASTVMVYGKDAPLPYMEECLGSAPSSPYGASKLACEALVNTYHALHKTETVNLRLFAVYGPDMREDCVPHLIASAIMKGRPFTVFGDGSSMRDYVEVSDVLAAIEAACRGHESYAALNIGSGFGTTLMDLLRLLEKCFGKKTELAFKAANRGELPVAVPDISLAMEKLHWEPRVSIEAGMARLADWFKSPACPLNGNGAR